MKKNTWKTVLTVVVLIALAAALVVAAVECANGAALANTAWSLLPPIIAIILALITKEAYSALFIGVLVGALFTCGFAPVTTLDTIVNGGLISAISATRASSCSSFCWASSSHWSMRRAAPPPSAAGPRRTSKRVSVRSWPRSCSACSFSSTTISTA